MPGDRRQILSLLRLPIPPLQPLSFLSVNCPNCNSRCNLGKLEKDELLQLVYCQMLRSPARFGIFKCHVRVIEDAGWRRTNSLHLFDPLRFQAR